MPACYGIAGLNPSGVLVKHAGVLGRALRAMASDKSYGVVPHGCDAVVASGV